MTARRVHPDDRPIKGWYVEATCPSCGGILTHIADGRPGADSSRAIAGCTACGRSYAVQLTIADASAEIGRRQRRKATAA